MKKVMFMGDIHGKPGWVNYAGEALKSGYEVVFLGDYVDSFDIKPYEIEQNLLRIIAFKKRADNREAWKTKVTLLLGNHDYAYVSGRHCSGHEAGWAHRYNEIFNDNWDLFNIAWGHTEDFSKEYTLVTHAGLTKTYWDQYIANDELPHYDFVREILGPRAYKEKDIHEILNVLKDKFALLWKVGADRGGDGFPGVLWADIRELKEDPMPGINQVVGHTGWHSMEYFKVNKNKNFIAKIDGHGKDVQRLIITL